ncbi:Gfo/Idh/MocA family protein [Ruegeria arenilitoris]|uniref:Gfo/Idh/MocA family protein n=1 Tax=Ruegeria arenilitoris TaxID=1173585 RepID=UPI00147D3EB6|nr:Gfo/Idh/MocA family oxidoreductase [Ruegeria arenilitoris]
MSQKLNVLLIGPGLIGRKHAEIIQQSSGARLAAIVAPDRGQNRTFADSCGVDFISELDQAFEGGGIDAAIVSSPNAWHFEQAMACIDRHIPVLVEKPITDDLASARKLNQAAEQKGVHVLVGHHRTHSSLLAPVEEFLNSPSFGQLVCVSGTALFYKPEEYFLEGEWRTRPGGGPVLINLIHEIGMMRHFCGEIVSVFALSSNAVRGFDVEDTVALTFAFKGGAIGSFLLSDTAASSKSWEMTSGENPAYPNYADESCYHFAGTMGSIDFPSMNVRSYLGGAKASWWLPFQENKLEVTRSDPLESQFAHFLQVVRGETQPRVSARDGYKNVLVIEAIKMSLESQQSVLIENLEAQLVYG